MLNLCLSTSPYRLNARAQQPLQLQSSILYDAETMFSNAISIHWQAGDSLRQCSRSFPHTRPKSGPRSCCTVDEAAPYRHLRLHSGRLKDFPSTVPPGHQSFRVSYESSLAWDPFHFIDLLYNSLSWFQPSCHQAERRHCPSSRRRKKQPIASETKREGVQRAHTAQATCQCLAIPPRNTRRSSR